jgi:hypothetical protein
VTFAKPGRYRFGNIRQLKLRHQKNSADYSSDKVMAAVHKHYGGIYKVTSSARIFSGAVMIDNTKALFGAQQWLRESLIWNELKLKCSIAVSMDNTAHGLFIQ